MKIDLSNHITALGHYDISAVAKKTGSYNSNQSNAVTYSLLSTVKIESNDAGGETYIIDTIDNNVTVDGVTYNVVTERGG